MPERRWHVSSAVVAVMPGRAAEVAALLPGVPGVEVHGAGETRVVVTIEGWSTGELGDRLTAISLMDGVISANMVFERSEEESALS